VGLGIALVGLLGSVRPLLLLPLVALRLYAFALSPAGEGRISEQPPLGVDGDFPHLERLQRLTHETRALLAARLPHPAPGTRVGYHHFPPMSRHAFAGDAALRVWYGVPSLAWVGIDEFRAHPDSAVAGFVEYESGAAPQLAFVDSDALRSQMAAEAPMGSARWPEALAALARADSLQRDPAAAVFRATTEALRSVCLLMLGQEAEAERQARHALEQWDGNQYSRYTLARLAIGRQRYAEAEALLTSQLALYPEDAGSRELLTRLRAATNGGSGR
jgi:tetratricopeptide (TPR) repeat protein